VVACREISGLDRDVTSMVGTLRVGSHDGSSRRGEHAPTSAQTVARIRSTDRRRARAGWTCDLGFSAGPHMAGDDRAHGRAGSDTASSGILARRSVDARQNHHILALSLDEIDRH